MNYMAFKMFKKKEEVLDLRAGMQKKPTSEYPVSQSMRQKIEADLAKSGIPTSRVLQNEAQSIVSSVETTPAAEPKKSNAVGFFSGFFGGGSSNSSANSSNSSNNDSTAITSTTSTTTSQTTANPSTTYGYHPTRTTSSSVVTIKSKLEDLSNRISRVVDRLELIERKIERIEGR
jgi:hypothetical protein